MRVLLVKMSSIGDILQCFGLPKLVKRLVPGAQVEWLVEKRFEGLVRAHPDVDGVVAVDRKRALSEVWRLSKLRYDVVIDLQGNVKSAVATGAVRSPVKVGFGKRSVAEWPNLLVTNHRVEVDQAAPMVEQYASLVKGYWGDETPYTSEEVVLGEYDGEVADGAIMVSVGSNWANKRLKSSHLIALLRSLEQKKARRYLFIYSGEEERQEAERLGALFEDSRVVGGLSLNEWQGLMRRSIGVICVDSAALHLAHLASVSTFAFFGPSSSWVYNPGGSVYQGECPYQEPFVKRCSKLRTCKTGECLNRLDIEKAHTLIERWAETLS